MGGRGKAGDERNDEVVDLERRFDGAMFEIYERAGTEVGYWASRYLQMLRARGGLETARRLLNAKTTSDGYARLRDSARLDLTVEALVLRLEFQPLFSTTELVMAQSRLEYFNRPLEISGETGDPVDPELLRLLEEAAEAPADQRVDYRDRVAAFGRSAIQPMDVWVTEGRSPGFACMVLEAVGRDHDRRAAVAALRRLRGIRPGWATVIEAAITRVEAGHHGAAAAARRPSAGDMYIAVGTPPSAFGPCGIFNRDGSACQNPGRHPVGDVLACTTHYKAATRRGEPL